jgi:hypothetical protein
MIWPCKAPVCVTTLLKVIHLCDRVHARLFASATGKAQERVRGRFLTEAWAKRLGDGCAGDGQAEDLETAAPEALRLGGWEAGKLGSWETLRGDFETWRQGDAETGRLPTCAISQRR